VSPRPAPAQRRAYAEGSIEHEAPALTSSSLAPECCPRAQAECIYANHLLGYPAAGTYWRDGNRQWVAALSLPSDLATVATGLAGRARWTRLRPASG
jgi:hypothetical protein